MREIESLLDSIVGSYEWIGVSTANERENTCDTGILTHGEGVIGLCIRDKWTGVLCRWRRAVSGLGVW